MNKPFLKWAGGKSKLVETIKMHLPEGKRLIEPFVGSGALFLNTHYPKYLLADNNQDLIQLYQYLQSEGQPFIDYCRSLFTPQNNQKKKYLTLRKQFNKLAPSQLRSALFIYFNRHGFNGLCRYNKKQEFNVPFGSYRAPGFPINAITFFLEKAQNAEFFHGSFIESMHQAKKGDVIYCDPPYVPLSKTSYFTTYSGNKFDYDCQLQLVEHAERLAKKGIPVLISNHDNDVTRKLYRNAKIISFEVRRNISCKGATRGYVKELLAIF